ncbi:MAG: cupin domain-containing protein [Clostridia bacterium]|nr:cupin domain-containing protein [Clostridia bacterium]
MEDAFNPRRQGKVHWHEEIVRPIKVAPEKLVHKNPLKDMYYDAQDRKHKARDVDLPMRTMNIHISEIPVGSATRLHKHHNEAVIYIIKGKGHTMIQGRRFDWEAGDFLYVPPFCWHSNHNDGDEPAYFMGITNKRLLNWLGLDRKVEAEVHVSMEEVEREIAAEDYSPYSWYRIDPEQGIRFGPDDRK